MADHWRGIAFNQVPDSMNQIHGDETAQSLGFKGGLVPGVTVSAYLLHPVTEIFGIDFLERGFSHCRVSSPLYDNETFVVEITGQSSQHCDTLLKRSSNEVLAKAETGLKSNLHPPVYRGDPVANRPVDMPATRENFERLLTNGCHAFGYRWDKKHEMSSYLRDTNSMSDVYALDGFANPSYILGLSNWVLSANIYMNPWIHLETWSQNFAPLSVGTEVICEMSVCELFKKKGHEFVDVEVNVFDALSLQCYASISLRAIYRLRGT